ncbi:MAG: hypothetical protein RB292_02915 [Patescibacteria group bacterium]|jgi:hypothetical protein|nr:hypothetical protein [Patescibacteria group bacterium]
MWTAIIFWLGFLTFLVLILGTFAWGGILAAPWVPLWKKDVVRMLTLAETKPGELVYDLGAGDGRMLIIAAKQFQAKAVGFEIAVLPYLLGYIKIILNGLRSKVSLKYRNFFKIDLSQADVILTFLTPPAMEKLKPKLQQEIKPTCRVVSYAFKIPGWEPVKIDKPDNSSAAVYLYRR